MKRGKQDRSTKIDAAPSSGPTRPPRPPARFVPKRDRGEAEKDIVAEDLGVGGAHKRRQCDPADGGDDSVDNVGACPYDRHVHTGRESGGVVISHCEQ